MSAESKQQKVTMVYKNQDLPPKAFGIVKTIAYNHFIPLQNNTDGINTMILEVAKLLDLDPIDYNGILLGALPAHTKFLNFISIIEGQDDDEYTAQQQFIEFLLNFKRLGQLGKKIEKELVKQLGDQIKILRASCSFTCSFVPATNQTMNSSTSEVEAHKETLVIGEKECPVSKVVLAMVQTPVSSELDTKWKAIALEFHTPMSLKNDLAQKKTLGLIETSEILQQILTEWRARLDKVATLQELINILERNGMNTIAQNVKEQL